MIGQYTKMEGTLKVPILSGKNVPHSKQGSITEGEGSVQSTSFVPNHFRLAAIHAEAIFFT
jgi:hypothetical protein